MKRDTDLKQLWLRYITFAHFTKSYFHVNPLLKPVPGIWKRFVLASYCCSNKLPQTWLLAATAAAKSLQSCPTLCDPIDGSPPGSPVPGILQARTLEWVA